MTSQALLLAVASIDPALGGAPLAPQDRGRLPEVPRWSVLEHALEQQRTRDPCGTSTLAMLTSNDFDQAASSILLGPLPQGRPRGPRLDRARRPRRWDDRAIERALGLALGSSAPPRPLAFLKSVVASTVIPGEGALGSTFVLELVNPKTLTGGDPEARSRPQSVLRDPRFKDMPPRPVPALPRRPASGCDRATWLALRAHARDRARDRVVIPGER
jgi:hypothetical protein